MRLDKYLAETAQCTRSEAKTMLAKGRVQVNGAVCKKGDTQLKDTDTVTVDGEYIELTPKEYDLLLYFMNNKGIVLSRDTLLSKVWGYDYFGDLRTVDTHIKKLRAKLGDKASLIKTMIKAGYKFEE